MTKLGLLVAFLQMLAISLLLFCYLLEAETNRKLEAENRKYRIKADHANRKLTQEQIGRFNDRREHMEEVEELLHTYDNMMAKYEQELKKLRYEKGQFLKWNNAKGIGSTEESTELDSKKGVDST